MPEQGLPDLPGMPTNHAQRVPELLPVGDEHGAADRHSAVHHRHCAGMRLFQRELLFRAVRKMQGVFADGVPRHEESRFVASLNTKNNGDRYEKHPEN